jgi:hypothetical protein
MLVRPFGERLAGGKILNMVKDDIALENRLSVDDGIGDSMSAINARAHPGGP